ncbi:MAG: acyl-CoA dehydrogenase family protein [Oligoflexales bacterium]|nr:acyl-CoA dehydrogenase family protein [Oligoflexales bacterium]
MKTAPSIESVLDYLNFEDMLSDEQRLIAKTVRSFVAQEVEPLIKEAYRSETFPTQIIPRLGELGLLGSQLKGYGLPGLDNVSYGLIMRELERCDSGLRSFASVQGALVMYPIHAFGSEEQKQNWLPKLGSGAAVGCFGLTEEYGGSDPANMKTKAEKFGDKWILNGSKMWITNGNLAQVAVVWAKTAEGIRGFVVPTNSKGFKAVKMQGKLSLRASVTSELYFENVELPLDAVLPKSDGLKSALSCLTQARYGIAWGALGAAEACFEEARVYVKDRILFEKPLAAKQLIQVKLAKICAQITNGQLLAMRLGQLKDAGALHFAQVSLGKQNNVALALDTARTTRDILGGNGIMDEYVSMRHMCNLETVSTYEGTNDVHLLVIGQQITGLPAY